MPSDELLEQAENCRRQALAYIGNAEAPFLLRVADAFEDLARADHAGAVEREEPGRGR